MIRPDVLLLDEPLSNLDAKLREEVRIEIRELQRQLGLTTIMVTHDQEEALTVADRLVVMADGEIRQIGSAARPLRAPGRPLRRRLRRPQHLPRRPRRRAGRVRDRRRAAPQMPHDGAAGRGRAGAAARAADARRGADGLDNRLPGRVEFVSYLGAVLDLHVRLSPADRVVVQLPNRGEAARPAVGDDGRGRLAARRRTWSLRGQANAERNGGTDMTSHISRRDTLKALGLAAGAAALPSCAEQAQAQAGRVVVGTWGGDYARLLTKNIEDPLLKPKGCEVVQDQAGDAPRRAKMLAERRLPRGTTDIQGLSAANMFEMNEAGVVEAIDYAKLQNAANLLPPMKYPYGVGHIYSGKVGVYNPKLIPDAPKSFKDVVRSRSTATSSASSTSSTST